GAAKKVKRITLLSDAMVRRSPPSWLSLTTEDSPTCMTSMRPDWSSWAPRLPAFMLMISTSRPWAAERAPPCAIHRASTVFTGSEMPTLKRVTSAAAIGCTHPAIRNASTASRLHDPRRCSWRFSLCTFVSPDHCALVIPAKLVPAQAGSEDPVTSGLLVDDWQPLYA